MKNNSYFGRKGRAFGKFWGSGVLGPIFGATKEMEMAMSGKRSWRIWKTVATTLSFALVAYGLWATAQGEIQRKGSLDHLFVSAAITPGLTLAGISMAVFFLIRYLLIYALVLIPFIILIGGMAFLMEK